MCGQITLLRTYSSSVCCRRLSSNTALLDVYRHDLPGVVRNGLSDRPGLHESLDVPASQGQLQIAHRQPYTVFARTRSSLKEYVHRLLYCYLRRRITVCSLFEHASWLQPPHPVGATTPPYEYARSLVFV